MNLRNSIYGSPHHSILNIYDVMQNEVLVWSDQRASCLNLPTMQVKKRDFPFPSYTSVYLKASQSWAQPCAKRCPLPSFLSWNRSYTRAFVTAKKMNMPRGNGKTRSGYPKRS